MSTPADATNESAQPQTLSASPNAGAGTTPVVPNGIKLPTAAIDGIDAIANRRDQAAKRLNGLAVTPAVLGMGIAAIAALVVLPLGRSHLTLPLGIGIGIATVFVALASTVFETTSRNGRILRAALIIGALSFALLFPLGRSNSTLIDLGLFAVFGIAVIGLNLTQGYAGQVSLAQAAFLGIGAYTSGLLRNGAEVSWGPLSGTLPKTPFLLCILIAAVMCFVLSVLIGFPALRVQGPWLAFVTVAFNGLVVLVMNNQAALTNGPQGVRALRTDLRIFGIQMLDNRNYYYFCLGVLVLVSVAVWWIIRSPWGRSFKAIRDNPGRAASLGVSVPSYKLLAFAIGSMLAGVAGSLYAPLVEFIEPGSFTTGKSFAFLMATVVGGVGTLAGPFIGTAFITFLENHLRFLGDNYQIVFALFVILMMIVSPKGVVGASQKIRAWIIAKRGAP
jgi:branched-chain amino acid transport system permease protein